MHGTTHVTTWVAISTRCPYLRGVCVWFLCAPQDSEFSHHGSRPETKQPYKTKHPTPPTHVWRYVSLYPQMVRSEEYARRSPSRVGALVPRAADSCPACWHSYPWSKSQRQTALYESRCRLDLLPRRTAYCPVRSVSPPWPSTAKMKRPKAAAAGARRAQPDSSFGAPAPAEAKEPLVQVETINVERLADDSGLGDEDVVAPAAGYLRQGRRRPTGSFGGPWQRRRRRHRAWYATGQR